jgi:tripartite-type tricarboxylate transporter receptor subunit TctC
MSSQLGQPLVIENRPGAATNVAAAEAARSQPDGYTVFTAGIETVVYNPALYKKLPFDPVTDFRPVGLSAQFHLLLTVKKDSPATSARNLIERAKASPGAINYGSPGLGSPHHLAMERLKREAGFNLTHVAYRGMAPVISDMMAGTVEVGIVDFAAGGGVLRAGTLRPLAVCSAKRLEALPDVPTVQEALGLKNFEAYAWQGVVVPAKTPDPIVARLTEALAGALRQEAVLSRMKEIGLDPLPGGPAEFQALLKAERDVWWPVIRDLGLSLE